MRERKRLDGDRRESVELEPRLRARARAVSGLLREEPGLEARGEREGG